MATIPDTALPRIARLIGGVDSVAPFTVIAVGTGTTAEATSQTALVNQVGQVTVTPTYEASNKTVWSGTISFNADYSLTEVAVLSSDLVMLMRHVWSVVRGISNGDSIQITVKATAGRSS